MAAPRTVIDGIGIRCFRTIRPVGAGEVIATNDLGRREGPRLNGRPIAVLEFKASAGAAQLGTRVADAAVQHGDTGAAAIIAERTHGACADVRNRLAQTLLAVLHRPD